MVSATENMIPPASVFNYDCKSRRDEIISKTSLTKPPMQQSLHLSQGEGHLYIWVRAEITHIEEGDGTSVKTNHNPEDASQLGQNNV